MVVFQNLLFVEERKDVMANTDSITHNVALFPIWWDIPTITHERILT